MWKVADAAVGGASNEPTLDVGGAPFGLLRPEDRPGMTGGARAAARLGTRQGVCYLPPCLVGEGKRARSAEVRTTVAM